MTGEGEIKEKENEGRGERRVESGSHVSYGCYINTIETNLSYESKLWISFDKKKSKHEVFLHFFPIFL